MWNFSPECEISRRRLNGMNATGIFTSRAVTYYALSTWTGLRTSSACAGTAGKTRRPVCLWCNVFFLSSRGLIPQSVLLSSATCLYYHSYGVDFDGACRFIRKGFTEPPQPYFKGSQWGTSKIPKGEQACISSVGYR
jgi:hypothetical protein